MATPTRLLRPLTTLVVAGMLTLFAPSATYAHWDRHDGWRHGGGWRGGWGWGGGIGIGPPMIYRPPPPIYYAPPPMYYYAPPPAYYGWPRYYRGY